MIAQAILSSQPTIIREVPVPPTSQLVVAAATAQAVIATEQAVIATTQATNSATSAKTSVSEADWQNSGSLVHTIQIVTLEENMPEYDEQTKQLTQLPGEWGNLFNQHGYTPTVQELQLAGFDNYVSTDYFN